jgi:hypothetical protein
VAKATTISARDSVSPVLNRLAAATDAATRSRGMEPRAPTLKPRFRRARRCKTGVSESPGPASQTSR